LLAIPLQSPPDTDGVWSAPLAAGAGAMTGPAPGESPGPGGLAPVRRRPCPRGLGRPQGLGRRQGGLSEPRTLARPGRRAFRTGAVMVDVLVDHVPGGVEQVYQLKREQIARRRGWSVHFG
jgi:hypothetical protein